MSVHIGVRVFLFASEFACLVYSYVWTSGSMYKNSYASTCGIPSVIAYANDNAKDNANANASAYACADHANTNVHVDTHVACPRRRCGD